jgi:hypothetical protein
VVGLFIGTMHIEHVAMNLIDMRRKCTVVGRRYIFEVLVLCFDNSGLLDQLTMEVIDVLGYMHAFEFFIYAILLELSDCDVASVRLFVFAKCYKVVVPLPDGFWLLLKKGFPKKSFRVCLAAVIFLGLPKTLVASKSRHSTGCAEACTCEYYDSFLVEQMFGCLFSSHNLGVVF